MASDTRPVEGAPYEGRRLLGVLLAQRRTELGYTHRPAFARDRLPLTESGNPNTRLLADIEEAYRDNFPQARLRQLARAYLVSYESLADVAHLRARALTPAPPGAAPDEPPAVPAEPPGWTPPMTDAARTASNLPYANRIWKRWGDLRGRGIAEPSGAQMFGAGTPDARDWDGAGSRMDLPDRVWFIADLQRRDDGRTARPGTAAPGA